MKKHSLSLMVVITCIFSAFTLGFFLGRNQNHETVFLSSMSSGPEHNAIPETVHYSDSSSPDISYPLDINSAQKEALITLPGIGPALAQRILDYRSVNGPFAAPEELLNVEGIGPGKLEDIMDYITTGG